MRKRFTLVFFACLLFFLFRGYVCAHDLGFEIERLERTPLPLFKEPKIVSGTLSNGIRYYLLPDHQIPIVNFAVIIKTGSIYEPSHKLGLAELVGITIKIGGTKNMTAEELDKFFDDRAAEITSKIGREMGTVSFKILSSDLYEILPVFFKMLFEPRFERKRVELGKLNMIEELKRENDYPEEIAAREFAWLVYGKENPWARRPSEKSIKSISIEDLRNFHSTYFVPRNIIIAAAGDFDANQLIEKIKDLTSDIPNREITFPVVPYVELKFPMQKKIIKRKLTQAFIEMGHLGIKRHNPDKYALEIMNMILGAPIFKSRLMEDIRSNRGLAYSISSDFGWGTDYGLFNISVDTMAENKDEVITLIEGHIKRMASESDITLSELDFAKKAVLNRMVFQFDNSFKITYQRALYDFYGYPPNYWHIYFNNIKKVTANDVIDVAHRYLHPDGLSIVVVGP